MESILPCRNRLEHCAINFQTTFKMSFKNGERKSPLKNIGKVGIKNTGTKIRFWADEKYFDSIKFSLSKLKHLMRAKSVYVQAC